MSSGIYKIKNIYNGKFYVGSSYDINKRWNCHKSFLSKNKHPNPKLQASYNKHGKDLFEYNILELCDVDKLLKREQHYIDTLKPFYNILPIAGSPLGKKASNITKIKVSKIAKAMWQDPKMRKKILASTRTSEARQRARESALRIWKDPAYRKQHSESLYGKGNSKLSPNDVREIRRLYSLGIGSPTICKMFRLKSTRSVFRILEGTTYRWVD